MNQKNEHPLTTPDPETLHTTDPQEEMKGPISSIVQAAKEKAEEEDEGKKKKSGIPLTNKE